MAPAYKLYYFDMRGLAEPIRFLLKYGNIEFEDVRVKKEDWPKLKENSPLGQMPFLEHNGKKAGQSVAIYRYIGNILKLTGKDDWENLEIDALADTITDLRQKVTVVHVEKDETKKKIAKEAMMTETLPYYLSRFEDLAKKNNGYLAAGQLTWVDFMLVSFGPSFDLFMEGNTFENYPTLNALRLKVEAFPEIKKWIEVRPKTEL